MVLVVVQLLGGLLYFFTVSPSDGGQNMIGLLVAVVAGAEGLVVMLGSLAYALYQRAMQSADLPEKKLKAVPAALLIQRMKQLDLIDPRLIPEAPTVSTLEALPQPFPEIVARLVHRLYWQYGRNGVLFLCSGGEAFLFLRPRDSAADLECRHEALSVGAIQEHTTLVGQVWPDAASAEHWRTCAAEVILQKRPTTALDRLPGAQQRDLGPLLTPHIHQWLEMDAEQLQEAIIWLYAVLNLYRDGVVLIPSIYRDPVSLPGDLVEMMQADGLCIAEKLRQAGMVYTHTRRGYGGWHGDCEDVVCKVTLSATESGWHWRQETLWYHYKTGVALS